LQNVNWSGNIRELRNIIERLIILCGPEITKEDIVRFANPKE
jgi:DNA-binding NtrC family response regulator